MSKARADEWIGSATSVGRRVVVTGMAGAGKSTFSRALSAKTGFPVIHLDLHFWKPGWVKPPDDEWREKQRRLLGADEWIADGNYHDTLELRLERAETVVFLDTPWWTCARRAFARGIRKRPVGSELPAGAMTPRGNGCATNGESSGASREAATQSANESSGSCRSTESTLRYTSYAPRGRCERFSTAWTRSSASKRSLTVASPGGCLPVRARTSPSSASPPA